MKKKFIELLDDLNNHLETDKEVSGSYAKIEPILILEAKKNINKFISEMIGFENRTNVMLPDAETIKDEKSLKEVLEIFIKISEIHSKLGSIVQGKFGLADFYDKDFYSGNSLILNNDKLLEKMDNKLAIILNSDSKSSIKTNFTKFDSKEIFSLIFNATLYSVINQGERLKINALAVKEINTTLVFNKIKGKYYLDVEDVKKYINKFNLKRREKGWFYSAIKMSLSIALTLLVSLASVVAISAFYPHPQTVNFIFIILSLLLLSFLSVSLMMNIYIKLDIIDKFSFEKYLILLFVFGFGIILTFLNYLNLNYIIAAVTFVFGLGIIYLTSSKSIISENKYLAEIGVAFLSLTLVYANLHSIIYVILSGFFIVGFYFLFRFLPKKFYFWVK
jgi:small nuclear ribonucleoprotein (snRNP)-like protein